MSRLAEAVRLTSDLPTVVIALITAFVLIITILILFVPQAPVDISDELRRTHRRLGIAGQEDDDGSEDQRPEPHAPLAGRTARIQSLWVYPVKSCQGIELSHSSLAAKGLEHDRLYTFAVRLPKHPELEAREAWEIPDPNDVDGNGHHHRRPEWEIATIRRLPLLANVGVDVWLPRDDSRHRHTEKQRQEEHDGSPQQARRHQRGLVVITFPRARGASADASLARGLMQTLVALAARPTRGWRAVPQKQTQAQAQTQTQTQAQTQIVLPLEFPSPGEIERSGYRRERLQFFRKSVEALNMGREVPPELAAYLGARGPISLFRMDPTRRRRVYGNAPRKEVVGFQPVVDFQDLYPVHLLSLSSLAALESMVQKDDDLQSLDVRRFRANIIVTGLPEFDEDDWRAIQAKSVTPGCQDVINLDVSCRTVRCKLPNVDPATGIRHRLEPDHTLRKRRDIDDGVPKNGCFGMHLCPLLGDADNAVLRVGMEIHVLQRGPHFYIKNTTTP